MLAIAPATASGVAASTAIGAAVKDLGSYYVNIKQLDPPQPVKEIELGFITDPVENADINTFEAREGDTYLLCSDGLCDMVDDEDILLTLTSLNANLPLAASQLVQMANDNGGRDNISVILIRVRKPFPASRGLLSRLKSWFGKNGD